MTGVVHALDYLPQADPPAPSPVTVVFGSEWLLGNLVLDRIRDQLFGDEPVPFETYDGEEVQWRDVRDEVATVSLFGQGKPRLAVIHSADDFISKHRAELEKYSEHPSSQSVLVLVTKLFAGNTRLYKIVQKKRLAIDCRVPEISTGRDKSPDVPRITEWLTTTAPSRHRARLSRSAAELLIELVGVDFGRLDNELAKLAIFVGEGEEITTEVIEKMVGGWRAETTWDMIDAMLAGEAHRAIDMLARLLQAGEHPYVLFGSVSWSLRRLAATVRVVERMERSGQRVDLAGALRKAGVFDRRGREGTSERQLRQVGRLRAAQLYQWLLELDLSLKGTHSNPERSRWAFERLILRLSKDLDPKLRA